MFVPERDASELEEGKDLQSVAVVVGDAEQRGIGIEREHVRTSHFASDATASISISIFGSGSACTTHVVRAG